MWQVVWSITGLKSKTVIDSHSEILSVTEFTETNTLCTIDCSNLDFLRLNWPNNVRMILILILKNMYASDIPITLLGNKYYCPY